MEEVLETVEKIRQFEDSIQTIWLPEQIEEIERNNPGIREQWDRDATA